MFPRSSTTAPSANVDRTRIRWAAEATCWAQGAALLEQERGATDKDLSAERSRSDKAVATRDDFLGMVSHDVRNMLNAVVGFAALIVKAGSDNPAPHTEDVIAYARRIERAGGRMNRLIGDLVDVASIEAGALGVTLEAGDPREIVSEVVDHFRSHASACGVTLTSDVASGNMRARFDAARLLQVLANLVGNAVKFTPRGGRVVLRIARESDHIRFEVRDTGIGIAATDLEAIFERFHQVKRSYILAAPRRDVSRIACSARAHAEGSERCGASAT